MFNHHFFLSFLSTTLLEHVANSILYCPRVLYFSSIFLMASTSEAIPFIINVLNRRHVSFIIRQGEYIKFDLFVGLKVQLLQYKENDDKNPVHSLLCIISFSSIDLH